MEPTSKNPGGRPRRTDLYRKINFNCTASADANISYVLGNSHESGLPMCTCRGDAIVLCIEQVADMMRRQQRTGEQIPWAKK
jgi:hypothetical protein